MQQAHSTTPHDTGAGQGVPGGVGQVGQGGVPHSQAPQGPPGSQPPPAGPGVPGQGPPISIAVTAAHPELTTHAPLQNTVATEGNI